MSPAIRKPAAADPSISVWVHGRAVEVPAGQWPEGQTPRALLRFTGPVQPAWRSALKRHGLALRFWCPPTGACVDVPRKFRGAAQAWSALDFVLGARDYTEAMCQRFDDGLGQAGAAVPPSALPADWYDLVCFEHSRLPAVQAALKALGAQTLVGGHSKLRVQYGGDPADLRAVRGVKLVDRARQPTLLSAAALRGSMGAAPGLLKAARLDGAGEVIAVADTGLDSGDPARAMHPDLAGRVRWLESLPMNASWQAICLPAAPSTPADDAADRGSSHGTHVAGLACGSGAASGGKLGGMAPAAELVFLAIERDVNLRPGAAPNLKSGLALAGRPLDLRELFRAGVAHGATLHNLSWGDATRGAYSDDCYETDLFLREDSMAMVVCAAGNDGTDADGNRRIDSGSIYSPACAKNCIAVGATEGPLQNMGTRATWADLDPAARRWRAAADRSDMVSGEADRIAPVSSAGPTVDGRTKPDLCAPGINLPSTRSRATSAQGWGLANPMPYYMYDGGTSMSAPMVTGGLALLRQAWRRTGRKPTGAALKALALLGCTPVRGRDGQRAATSEAGYGGFNLARALPPSQKALAGWRVQLRDAKTQRLETGQHFDVAVTLRRTAGLRAVLCWMDPAGERLINDLDLSLLAPDQRVLAVGGAGASGATPDRINTVECIDERGLPAGRYTLRVSGFNVMDGPQRFALAWAMAEAPA